MRFFREWCEERDIENLNDLTGRRLADFVDWRRAQISPVTLQKQLSTIREVLRFWADIEAVPDGLAEKVHTPEVPDGAQSRDVHLSATRAEDIISYLSEHHYGSRDHVVMVLLWRTTMRRSALRSIDVDDIDRDEHAIWLEHRPDAGTKLKNGEDGERWVYLGPGWWDPIDSYLDNPDREDVTDDHGREPLIISSMSRVTSPKRFRPEFAYSGLCLTLHPPRTRRTRDILLAGFSSSRNCWERRNSPDSTRIC
jgi:site-specific recombinase XerD